MDSLEIMAFFAGLTTHFNPQAPVNPMSGVQDQRIQKITLKGANYVVKVSNQEGEISQKGL